MVIHGQRRGGWQCLYYGTYTAWRDATSASLWSTMPLGIWEKGFLIQFLFCCRDFRPIFAASRKRVQFNPWGTNTIIVCIHLWMKYFVSRIIRSGLEHDWMDGLQNWTWRKTDTIFTTREAALFFCSPPLRYPLVRRNHFHFQCTALSLCGSAAWKCKKTSTKISPELIWNGERK